MKEKVSLVTSDLYTCHPVHEPDERPALRMIVKDNSDLLGIVHQAIGADGIV